MNVVEMHGICKYFGNFCANKNIEFTLKQGEVMRCSAKTEPVSPP